MRTFGINNNFRVQGAAMPCRTYRLPRKLYNIIHSLIRSLFVVKGLKVVSGQAVDDDKERIVSLCREKNGMLKIYLNGELEQSVYDVAIVNPNIKATPVIVNASLENTLGQLKIMNRALDYKENKNMVLK